MFAGITCQHAMGTYGVLRGGNEDPVTLALSPVGENVELGRSDCQTANCAASIFVSRRCAGRAGSQCASSVCREKGAAGRAVQSAWYGRAAIVKETAGPLGELAGGNPFLAAETYHIEGFAAGAEDKQLPGRQVIDAPQRLPGSLARRPCPCRHRFFLNHKRNFQCRRHGRSEPQSWNTFPSRWKNLREGVNWSLTN